MADPRRKKKKSSTASPAPVIELHTENLLYFMTKHPKSPYQFDLECFSKGRTEQEIINSQKNRAFPFTGRPQLIEELAPAIRLHHYMSPATTGDTTMHVLRWWWRFFDMNENIAPVRGVADINQMHYALYRNMGDELPPAYVFQQFLKVLNTAREILNDSQQQATRIPPLMWAAVERPSEEKALVTFDDIKRLYNHLKRICFPAIDRYECSASSLPTKDEVSALYTLFIMVTGWNVSVAEAINVKHLDANGIPKCIIPHPSNPQFKYVMSRKARAAGAIQYALSREKSKLSPSNIIVSLIKSNAPLRNKLQHYRRQLINELTELRKSKRKSREIDDLRLRLSEVDRDIESPWLYQSSQARIYRPGTVAEGVAKLDRVALNKKGVPLLRWYAMEINEKLSAGEKPVAEDIQLRDLRDAFISWRWTTSHSWLDAMLAAGHSSRSSLVRYLKRKQLRESSRRDFLKVGDAIWETAVEAKHTNEPLMFPTIVAAKVADASQEQIIRWAEGKDQTYCGTGCVDFYHPPVEIAPHHEEGKGCRIQRCTLCKHAILLPNSDDLLARRQVELRNLRNLMSETAWQQSDFGVELDNTIQALERFDKTAVEHLIEKWELSIAAGQHRPLVLEGAYSASFERNSER